MNNALLYLGGLVILALSALFAVPYFVDWNSYRGVFEEEATRVLGRDVRVGGSVNLRLLPTPYVRFEKLKIADVGSEAGESVFRADSFTMWLSIPPLLQGLIEARKIEIKRPMLRLVADANGGGNWQSLTLSPTALTFVPKGVALQSVSIVDGIVALANTQDGEIARIEGLAGELAADALAGPYRFAGQATWQGEAREIRLSTTATDADGSMRFKTSVRVPASGNSYVVSGTLSDLSGKPKMEGELNAVVRLRVSPTGKPDTPAAGPKATPQPAPQGLSTEITDRPAAPAPTGGAPPFEMHAKVTGDTGSLALDDINLSLVEEGAPQIITGSAKLAWAGKPHVELALASRWLDLDRLAHEGDGATATAPPPLATGRAFFEGLAGNLPLEADADAAMTLDQVTLGGEAIGQVRLKMHRAGGPFEIKEFRAGLPGGTRIEAAGRLDGAPLSRSFDGTLALRGTNLSRLVTWAAQGPTFIQGHTEGAFGLDGRLKFQANAIEIADADAELAGQPLTGDMRLTLDGAKTLALSIEGQRVDVGSLWPDSLEIGSLRRLLGMAAEAHAPAPGEPAATPHPAAPAGTAEAPVVSLGQTFSEISLKVRAAEMVDGDRTLKDVDADVALSNGALAIRQLHIKTTTGLVVDLDGRDGGTDAKGARAMTGRIEAPTGSALATLAAAAGLADETDPAVARWSALAPVRLAGSFAVGSRTSSSADLSFDGVAGGGRAVGRAHLDGGWSGWRTGPADITLTLDGAQAWRLAGDIFGAGRAGAARAAADASMSDTPGSGRLLVKAIGTPSKGLLTVAGIERNGRNADFEGRVVLPAGAPPSISGELTLKNAEASPLLALAGLEPGAALSTALTGPASITVDGGRIEIKPRGLSADGAKIEGSVVIAAGHDPAGPRTVTADLDVDTATVPGLLALILDKPQPAAALQAAPQAAPAAFKTGDKRPRIVAGKPAEASATVPSPQPAFLQPWPEQAFTADIFTGIAGTATVRFATLALEPGFAMHNAKLKAAIAPGKLTIEDLQADAAGGTLTSAMTLEKAAAGVTLNGKLAIGVKSSTASASADVAAFNLDFAGQALGPAALIGSLNGKGEVEIGNATLTGNTPKAVAAVAEAALQGKGANSGDELADALKTAVRNGALPLGKLTLPVTLASGNLSLDKLEIETPDGKSSLKVVVELPTLRIDSEWQIAPRVTRTAPPAPEGQPQQPQAGTPPSQMPPNTQPGGPQAAAPAAAEPAQPAVERVLLPPLTVSYTGKLRDFSALEPIVATASLERELSVRKMERDVDELERLRRQDQARAKADLERQKAQEEERAKALAAEYAAPLPLPADGEDEQQPEGAAAPDGTQPGQPQPDGTTLPNGQVQRPYTSKPRKKSSDDSWKPFQIQPF